MSLQNELAEFAEIIFSEDEQTDILMPSQNMIIYRNNMTSNLVNTLLETYPMVARLVGEDFFRITAKVYIHRYPSRSGNLHDYGEYFSDFLAEYPPVKNLSYLAEVAEFEWSCHLLHFASDHAALDLKSLEKISPDQYHKLHFILHPASRIIKFHYPILRILDLCKGEIDEQINVNDGGVNLLIIRRDVEIMLVSLSQADFTFLTALHDNKTFSEALDAAMLIDSDFKLDERLPVWIQDKTIVDFYLSND